ncbi:MAG: zinc-binding dehydrogenase [Streptosporangiaceae bacterium]
MTPAPACRAPSSRPPATYPCPCPDATPAPFRERYRAPPGPGKHRRGRADDDGGHASGADDGGGRTGHFDVGDLRVEVGATFPLAQAADAHRALEAGQVVGKVVLTM